MSQPLFYTLLGAVLSALLILSFLRFNGDIPPSVVKNFPFKVLQSTRSLEESNCSDSGARLVELSRIFNRRLEDHAIFVCSLKSESTSKSGAFCANALKGHMTDSALMNFLCSFLNGSTVGSFGDGLGIYKKTLLERKCVTKYDAYDGTPDIKNISEGRVQFLDLSVPQYGLPKYDIVMSLEVGEHIPAQFEDIFIDNLVRHAKNKIILSWAILGQGGHAHVNNRDPKHVVAQMEKRGFHEIPKISEQFRKNASFGWFKNTIRYYERNILLSTEVHRK